MKTDAKKILEEAMQLEPATRAFIAEALLEGLDFEQDFEVSQTWRAEIQRRCDEIDRGNAKLVDSDTVMAELRKKHACCTSGGIRKLNWRLASRQGFTGKDSQVLSSGFSTFSKMPSAEFAVAPRCTSRLQARSTSASSPVLPMGLSIG